MEIIVFKADVRAQDANLGWLNDQCRRELNTEEASNVADMVLANCTFVADWKHVPETAVRIVSTRAAEQKVMDEFLIGRETTEYVATDEVQNNTLWVPAGPYITRKIDRACYEYFRCRLFVNAVIRMTYNERQATVNFSQGQVAVVTELPDASLPFNEQKLTLRLAPPGVRQIDPLNIPQDWPQVFVSRRTTHSVIVGRSLQMGRRKQFPVRYHLTSTIHRIQGETVPLYATQVSDSHREYRLWQKEQFAVLISRAKFCKDIIFVGDKIDTKSAIINIFARSAKWDKLVDNYISALDVLSHPPVRQIDLNLHPFTALYRELPTALCGYVYLLASIPNSMKCYVGETENLKKTLREHNTGYGPEETRPTNLHPWGVFGFICGFEHEDPRIGKQRRKDFYTELMNTLNTNRGPEYHYSCMPELVTQKKIDSLIIVKCGELPGTHTNAQCPSQKVLHAIRYNQFIHCIHYYFSMHRSGIETFRQNISIISLEVAYL